MDQIEADAIEQLVKELGLPESDLYLFGDGSGTTISLPCSHFCTMYNNNSKEVKTFFGGFTSGTNNFAELMPYIHALWVFNSLKKEKTVTSVTIVSDSELTVRCGNGKYTRNANLPLWAAIDWYQKNGFSIYWHHVRRNSNFLMELADKRAGEFRCIISEQLFSGGQDER